MTSPTRPTNSDQPLVSVIIPTKNSATTLERCLDAIKAQTYKSIEIIVVDNHSSDDTVLVARRFTEHVFTKGPERTFQVNFAATKATGKYLYYTGSDLAAEPELIAQAVEACENQGSDAVYLNVVTNIPNPNIWQRARGLERRLYYHEPGMSAARFYKKEVFLALGGLDEKLGGISDDLEFQHRINSAGYKTSFIDASENNFGEYNSLKIIITRSLYYGWQIRAYFRKTSRHHLPAI